MGNKLPYDVINSGLKTIAGKLDAELPTKKYSNVKDEIAGTVNAIAGADIGGGGGGGSNIMMVTFSMVNNTMVADKTFAEILEFANNGGLVIADFGREQMPMMAYNITYNPSPNESKRYHQFMRMAINTKTNAINASFYTLYDDESIQYNVKVL